MAGLFFVALFTQVIDPAKPNLPQAALVSIPRTRLINEARSRVFRIVSAVILLAFAGKLAREVG